ncbi:hypothetical protein Tco_0745805 [Tanacetum coccineum]
MGLWYPKDSGFELTAFSDDDHAGCLDTQKSTSGGIHFLGNKLVSWMSKKQNCTPMSSAEAETEYQLADMFTKALPEDRFKYLVRRIGMRCLTPAELEVSINQKLVSFGSEIHTLSIDFHSESVDIEQRSIKISLGQHSSSKTLLKHPSSSTAVNKSPTQYPCDICQNIRVILLVFTMKMEILLESTSNKLLVGLNPVVTVSQSTKVDSLPHVHAHSTKTIYQEFQDKT